MKSVLKILVPLGLLLGVVFAVTFFSRTTPKEADDGGGTPGGPEVVPGQALVFGSATRKWDPAADAPLLDTVFPGFFEAGETLNVAHFWFVNRYPTAVTFRVFGVSCSSCSGGRVAVIPPDATRDLLQMVGVSALPFGPVAGCPLGLAEAAAGVNAKLTWQAHTFKDGLGNAAYDVPAAGDGWTPTWGILELNFKVRPNASAPLKAAFFTVAGGRDSREVIGKDEFSIFYEAVAPLDVDKSAIEAGELADTTPAQTHVVTVFSAARAAADLPDLTARVVAPGGDPAGPFVTAGKAEPVPPAELDALAAALAAKTGKQLRVRSAFRIPVTVRAKDGAARPDLGKLEREVWVTANVPGLDPRRVAVRATVTGPVSLAGATDVNLGTFRAAAGGSERVVVVTDDPKAVLEVAPGSVRPDGLDVTLKKVDEAGGKGRWQLGVRVAPGRIQGEIVDGLIVLELKGPTPLRVRVPVRGRGAF